MLVKITDLCVGDIFRYRNRNGCYRVVRSEPYQNNPSAQYIEYEAENGRVYNGIYYPEDSGLVEKYYSMVDPRPNQQRVNTYSRQKRRY